MLPCCSGTCSVTSCIWYDVKGVLHDTVRCCFGVILAGDGTDFRVRLAGGGGGGRHRVEDGGAVC